MFEKFIPVEIKQDIDIEADMEKEHINNLSDSLTTNQSLKDFKDDKFADFDLNV